MGFFEFLERAAQKIATAVITFLLSPAAPWIFLVVGLVVLFFLLRALYRKLRDKHLYQLTYERSFSQTGAYVDDEIELIEVVTNNGFFPLFHVDVYAYLYNELRLTGYDPPKKDGMQLFSGRFNLWPYMRIRRRHKVRLLRRGFYRLESAAIPTKDTEYYLSCPAEIYVYPKPVPIEQLNNASGRMQGNERAVRQLFSDPFSISGVRDYRFGDPLTTINFKVSARTWMCSGASSSPLKVNAREFCANRRIMVFMDFHTERDCGFDGQAYLRRVEAGLSYSAAFIMEAIYGGFNAAFFCNCKLEDGGMSVKFPLSSGEDHMLAIFKAMATLRPADGVSYATLLEEVIEQGIGDCEIISIVLCPSAKNDERLAMLGRMGNGVHQLVLTSDDEANAV
jgi:uncharacterized protein (DUF58 family)